MLDETESDLLPMRYRLPISVASSTWLLADCWKRGRKDAARAKLIESFNTFWLRVSLVFFAASWVMTRNDVSLLQSPSGWPWHWPTSSLWRLPWAWILWSRCTEIGIAFFRDAFDKIAREEPLSNLKAKDRLRLAFKSYGELILNFAMLFALCPADMWTCGPPPAAPHSLTDTLYFSATTITTSGNGAMIPARGLLQFLSTYEIFCGLILLVVCFTIYTGLGKGDPGSTCKVAPASPASDQAAQPSSSRLDTTSKRGGNRPPGIGMIIIMVVTTTLLFHYNRYRNGGRTGR